MRTSYSIATVCVFAAAVAALLPACGSSTDETPPGTAGTSSSGGATGAGGNAAGGSATCSTTVEGGGDVTRGSSTYGTQCASCHGPDAAGNQGPNITLSMTAGIGSWTYGQFYNAVRNAKDKDGTPLCYLMAPFAPKDVSDCGVQDIYAFIKSKPANNTVNVGSYASACMN